jgi:carboxypeptidase family protein
MKPILAAAVVALVCMVHASPVQACDCVGFPTCATLWNAELAFIGKVDHIATPRPGTEETTLIIEEWLRGEVVKKEVTIVSVGVGVSCDYDFTPETRYIVFAYKAPDGSWKARLCGGTTPLDSGNGKAALKEIRAVLNSRESGQVSGEVAFDEDPAERVMPGAAITRTLVRLRNDQRTLTTRTDERGEFRFSRVPPGRYALSVALPPNATDVPPMQVVVGAKACVQRYVFPHRRE